MPSGDRLGSLNGFHRVVGEMRSGLILLLFHSFTETLLCGENAWRWLVNSRHTAYPAITTVTFSSNLEVDTLFPCYLQYRVCKNTGGLAIIIANFQSEVQNQLLIRLQHTEAFSRAMHRYFYSSVQSFPKSAVVVIKQHSNGRELCICLGLFLAVD